MIPVVVSAFVGVWLALSPFVVGQGLLFELPFGVMVVVASLVRIGYAPARWVTLAIGLWFVVTPVLMAGRIPWAAFVFDVCAGLVLVTMAVPRDLSLPRRPERERHSMSGF